MSRLFRPDSPLMEALSQLFDCMVRSALAVLCALPVVTAGASAAALYAVTAAENQGGSGGAAAFFRQLRRCFAAATKVFLVLLTAAALLAADIWIVGRMSPRVRVPLWGGLFFLLLWLLLTAAAALPLASAAPETPLAALLRQSARLAIARLPRYGAVVLASAVPLAVLAVSPRWFWGLGLVWLFFWPGFFARLWVRLSREPRSKI